MIIVRQARPGDAAAIARIQVQTWQTVYRGIVADRYLDAMSVEDRTTLWIDILQKGDQRAFIAVNEGHEPVGFINGGKVRETEEDGRGEIYAIYILPAWHRKRIGEQLVGSLAAWLQEAGYRSLLVWVLADNPSRRFYERMGGVLMRTGEIRIGDESLSQVSYAWDDLRTLVDQANKSRDH